MSQILARLQKVLALARDERANPHLRQRAQEAVEKLARKHGIDLATVKLDECDHDRFNVAEVTLKTRNFQFEVRVCSMLVGTFGSSRRASVCAAIDSSKRPQYRQA